MMPANIKTERARTASVGRTTDDTSPAWPLGRCHISLCALITILLLLVVRPAVCAPQEVRLFVVEKSKNPQNILVVYTQADPQCTIKPVTYGKMSYLFDFYWLMDGTRFKPTHPLIKKLARRRFVAQKPIDNQKGFEVKLADLKELVHDLPSDTITITLHETAGGGCRARVLLPLGPSAGGRTLDIESIYSKARTLLGLPIGVHYIELRGRDAKTHEPMTVKFDSKENATVDTVD